MTFQSTVFPSKFIGFGSVVGPQHDTMISQARNGYETKTSNWRQPRRQFDVRNEMSEADMRELQEFVIAREGSLNSFNLSEPSDNTTATNHIDVHAWDDVRIGTGDSVTTVFDMIKRYQSEDVSPEEGRYEVTRRLLRTADIKSGLDGVEKTVTTDFTLDLDLGRITYNSAPARGVGVFGGCSFFTEVRFKRDVDRWLSASIDQFDSSDVSAPMVEEKSAAFQDHDRNVSTGGKVHAQTVGTIQLEIQHGYLHFVTPTAAMTIRLPDLHGSASGLVGHEKSVAAGGPYFSIFNLNVTHSVTVQALNSSGVWTTVTNGVIAPQILRKCWVNATPDWRVW